MSENNKVSFYDFAAAISQIVETASPSLKNHHKRTAFIAANIALKMNLEEKMLQEIILASLMHDIGAFSQKETAMILSSEILEEDKFNHAEIGFNILRSFVSMENAAYLIKYHHADFDLEKYHIPLGSYIIRLADRVSVLFDDSKDLSDQIPLIYKTITEKFDRFHPSVFDAFADLEKSENMWKEAFYPSLKITGLEKIKSINVSTDLLTLKRFANAISIATEGN